MDAERLFGLIGYPLGHSFSAKYFTEKFAAEHIDNCCYKLFPLQHIGMLRQLLESERSLCGLNVTTPYKRQVIPFLDTLSPQAKAVGAVNCIRRLPDMRLEGHNTDIYGFETSLLNFLGQTRVERALVLGSGGASLAVGYVLGRLGIEFRIVSRTPREGMLTYEDLPDKIGLCQLIVNATPLGTWPNTQTAPPIPYPLLGPSHRLFDLVYNPPCTMFMTLGAQHGAQCCNGAEMLRLQAERSWEIWNSK